MTNDNMRAISEEEARAIKLQLIQAQDLLENVDPLSEWLPNHDQKQLEKAWELIDEITSVVLK